MGKQKRRQKPNKRLKYLPFKDEEDEEIKSDNENVLQNIYSNIQSHNFEEKFSALQVLSSMSCNSSIAKQIAKDGIAKIIGPMLIDKNIIIRSSTATALKDIAENGEEEACSDLVKDDIMTPLITLFNKYYLWNPEKENPNNKANKMETFIEAVGLLWVLCANNENALNRANKENLPLFLTKFININVYGIKVVTTVIQCMVCLSDENNTAVEQIKKTEPILFSLLDLTSNNTNVSEVLYLKTAVADLLNNISNCTDSDQMHVLRKIVLVLSEVLAVDLTEILSRLTSILPHESNISHDKLKKIQESKNIFEAQEQALQIIANLCFEEENDLVDSDLDYKTETEIYSDDDPTNYKKPSTLAVELVEVIDKCSLIDKVWCKAKFMVDDDSRELLDQTTDGKAMLKYFNKIQCTAYLCLNNLISSMEIDVFGDILTLYKKCFEIADIFREEKNNVELVEAASAAMRAILQRLVEIQTDVLQLTYKDIEPIVNDVNQCQNTNVRVNLIRILSDMVRIAINGKEPERYKMIKDVSMILLDICEKDTLAWVIAESIDALMDIHGEEDTDHVALEIDFVPRLRNLVSHFKSKVNEQKKCLKDHMCIVSTVNENLSRFIRYKERKMRKFRGRSEDD